MSAIGGKADMRFCTKGEQTVTVKHVHVHAGGQAVVGIVTNRGGRGERKMTGELMNAGEKNQQPVQFQKARQCGARTKSGRLCRSPATKKGRCRLHGGARGSGGPSGERMGTLVTRRFTATLLNLALVFFSAVVKFSA
jgi:hypothetical protein